MHKHGLHKDMEGNKNIFIDNQSEVKRVTTSCSDLASSCWQEKFSFHLIQKLRSPNKHWYDLKKLSAIPYNKPYSNLWISWMRDPYIESWQGNESAFMFFISVLLLIVLASTWRLSISYSSLVEFWEASVIGESYGRFHAFPPCKLTLPFVTFPLSAPCRRATCS